MNAILKLPTVLGDGTMTFEEYLDWRAPPDDPGKWELVDGFLVYAMSEGEAHVLTKLNLHSELKRSFPPKGSLCRPMGGGLRMKVAEKTGLIPDAAIQCKDGEGNFQHRVIFEVSVTSLGYDMTDKRRRYFEAPSVLYYVVLNVTERLVWVWRRDEASGQKLSGGELTLELSGGRATLNIERFWDYL